MLGNIQVRWFRFPPAPSALTSVHAAYTTGSGQVVLGKRRDVTDLKDATFPEGCNIEGPRPRHRRYLECIAILGLVEEGPCEQLGALGWMRSAYIRDPDGNLLKFAAYSREPLSRIVDGAAPG